MHNKKKLLIAIPIIAVMLLIGVTAGIAFAQDGPKGPMQDITARVAKILGITQQKLEDAYKQANSEAETARLAQLVKDGKITQAQADAWKKWEAGKPLSTATKEQMDAWMKTRPDIPALSPRGNPGVPPNMDAMLTQLVKDGKITQAQADALKKWEAAKPPSTATREQMDAWMKARPDVPLPKFGPGPRNGRPPGPPPASK